MRLIPSSLALFTSISILIASPCLARRTWNDTGRGTIAFEESWATPEIMGPLSAVWVLTFYCYESRFNFPES
jgi:hypothetical protein